MLLELGIALPLPLFFTIALPRTLPPLLIILFIPITLFALLVATKLVPLLIASSPSAFGDANLSSAIPKSSQSSTGMRSLS